MPIYEFLNKNTNEVEEINMKISDLDKFKDDNPHMIRHFSTLNFQDSVSLGIKRPPIEFKEGVIDRIKRANPLNRMESRWD